MTDHRKRDPKGRILPAEVWRPIETAPKDGTHFLIPGDGEHASASWDGKQFRLNCCGQTCDATHWMPLPKPPQGDEV